MTDSKKTDLEKKDSALNKEDLSLWQEAMRDTKRQVEKSSTKSKKISPEEQKTKGQKTKEMSQEDKELWTQYTQSLQPLDVVLAPASSGDEENLPKEIIEKSSISSKKQIRALNIDLPVDIDKRTFERLKKGRLPLEDSFDFHGIGFHDAHYRLIKLIEGWQENGKRCVLIITGKGSRTPKDQKTIRDAFPDWLNDPLLRSKILAYTKAQPKHGGSGAFYLLLRRKKENPA
ncbi:MAG: Smr/MutS family protein [Alphaproteobacteria bacterium]|nr:Smr/MutS family protein [Alphaproteobacteria bacterium]